MSQQDSQDERITAYFTSMSRETEINNYEYLMYMHENSIEDKQLIHKQDNDIILSDFLPEPTSLSQVLRLTESIKNKWGTAIYREVKGLFDSNTFGLSDRPLPTDEIVPVKLALKTKLNSHGGLDKLKARVCLRGDMQEKGSINVWSPTSSTRLLKRFIADAIHNGCKIYQLDFIQAFIQSEVERRIFVTLDKEYKLFCPDLSEHLGRPLRLKKCLYGADFSGKSWYDTLDQFLTSDEMKFIRSMVEGCLYIYRKDNDWIKIINYVDDACYYCSNDEVRIKFENKLKKRFNLTLMGEAKWYLGMQIKQYKDHITLDQHQYSKNVTSRIEKTFKNPIKLKDSPLPAGFTATKKDCPQNQAQIDEIRRRFQNLHYRSVIGSLLYISCCTRPDICYAVNKLAKYSNNPGVTHYKALLHLVGFMKALGKRGLKFYKDIQESPLFHMMKMNNIIIKDNEIIMFTDSSWNDCIDTGRSTGGYIAMIQGGAVDYGSHLPVPVAMSSGEAEYIASAVACMRSSHLRMLGYDIEHMGKFDYNPMEIKYDPSYIIIDNEAAKCMSECNKDTAGNRHVARRYHYVRQGSLLNEHKFKWIGTKSQLADPMTKEGGPAKFKNLWDIFLIDTNNDI